MNDWREGFVAMSALLGEPLEPSFGDLMKADDLPLSDDLRDEDKSRRAVALSRALAAIAVAADDLELVYPS